MIYKDDEYTLSTGKTISANCGILGINILGNDLCIHDGYDGSARGKDNLTLQERVEVGEYIIRLWEMWIMKGEN